jgi:MFS family permease
MCLNGFVFLFIMASSMTLAASLVEPENRGKVRGFLNFMGNISTALGQLLGAFFFNLIAPLPFYVTIAMTIPILLIIIFRVHEPRKGDKTY